MKHLKNPNKVKKAIARFIDKNRMRPISSNPSGFITEIVVTIEKPRL